MLEAETDADQRANNSRALAVLKQLGCTMHPLTLPSGDLSYFIEYVERAAAFDSFTVSGQHNGLQSGDEPDGTPIDCGAQRLQVQQITGRRDVHRPPVSRRRPGRARESVAGPVSKRCATPAAVRRHRLNRGYDPDSFSAQ